MEELRQPPVKTAGTGFNGSAALSNKDQQHGPAAPTLNWTGRSRLSAARAGSTNPPLNGPIKALSSTGRQHGPAAPTLHWTGRSGLSDQGSELERSAVGGRGQIWRNLADAQCVDEAYADAADAAVTLREHRRFGRDQPHGVLAGHGLVTLRAPTR